MILGQAQQFASPTEALTHVSETPWSTWSKADYTLEQWHAACLVHIHDGEPTSKSQCKLPVKTPDGALNRHGAHAAAAALAGARGGLKGVSAEQKNKAAAALRRYYSQLDEDPPESLAVHGDFREKPGSPEEVLEHFGVKGMRWGVRKDRETSGDIAGHLSTGLGDNHPTFALKDTGSLTVDHSKGYADVRPKDGFANKTVAARHAEIIATLDEMRERYPSVAKMKIDVIPMSHDQGQSHMVNASFACVQAIKSGEARIMYNDVLGELTPYQTSFIKSWMPGVGTKNYIGYHEMGHLLSVSRGIQPPTFDIVTKGSKRQVTRKYAKKNQKQHKAILKKHGFSFKELKSLSQYSATMPSEAFAELAGHYHSSEMRKRLTPEQVRKAKALFDDVGGVS